jgi:hypothetical protein
MVRRLNRAWLAAIGGILLAPVGVPMAMAAARRRWSCTRTTRRTGPRSCGDAASAGDQSELRRCLLSARPEGIDADGRLAKAVAKLKADFDAREAKRTQEVARVTKELDENLGEANAWRSGDLAGAQVRGRAAHALERTRRP